MSYSNISPNQVIIDITQPTINWSASVLYEVEIKNANGQYVDLLWNDISVQKEFSLSYLNNLTWLKVWQYLQVTARSKNSIWYSEEFSNLSN